MKRLAYLILIITLPLLVFFQWRKYRRFNPPTDYSYEINDAIDPQYHDPDVVLQYYQAAEATGTYARYCWRKHRVDVKVPDLEDPEEATMTKVYQQHLATAQALERRLLQSAKWKAQGLSTSEIQTLERSGMSSESLQTQKLLGADRLVRFGEESPSVWHIQKLLIAKGYNIRLDGIFDQETLTALNAFQAADSLAQTYGVDEEVLGYLME